MEGPTIPFPLFRDWCDVCHDCGAETDVAFADPSNNTCQHKYRKVTGYRPECIG